MTRVTSSPRRAKSADRIDGAIRYMERTSTHSLSFTRAALACGPCVAVHRVADRAARRLLTYEPETRLAYRAVDDEAHDDALHTARGVEGNQADVVLREGLPAALQFHQ